jgi:PD-(D/E)XK nuclease superfamily protein
MSSSEFDLDTFLDDSVIPIEGFDVFANEAGKDGGVSWQEPDYEGTIDYRIRQLSYSSLLSLHSCPRKFQLSKLRTTHRAEESLKSTITFSFGHVVGDGIAALLEGLDLDQVIWRMFLGWHTPSLHDEDPKGKKSFTSAVIAIQRLHDMLVGGFLDEYELVYYNGKPAAELSFAVTLPDGFRLRGFVDAVLRNTKTNQILVLECKTTGFTTINPATYKNSAQAIGYSIVLDVLYPDLSSYEVLYLVYQTTQREFHPIPFVKTYLQRALWIRELLLDIETIKMYADADIYPMRGESCVSFGRDCEYLQSCNLSTQYLTKPCTPEEEDRTDYQIKLTLDDLITTQLEKTA